jgi:hypothetical protein
MEGGMFQCFFIEKKLYDYLDNTLSEKDKMAVKEHLESCPRCARILSHTARLVRGATETRIPVPGEDFWHNFKEELNGKLDQRLGISASVKKSPALRLRPALAMALILVVVIITGALLRFSGKSGNLVQPYNLLIQDIRSLEKINFDFDPEFQAITYINGLQLSSQPSIGS